MRFGWAMLAGGSLAQSAAFSGFFYASAFSQSDGVPPRPSAGTPLASLGGAARTLTVSQLFLKK